MMDIFDRIKQLIEFEGLSVASFAKKIQIGDQTVRNIVVNRRNEPSLKVLSAICQSFDCINAEWLICGAGEMIKRKNVSAEQNTPINERLVGIIESQQRTIEGLAKKTAAHQAANAECADVAG